MPTIIMAGNLSEGFRAVGPFDDHDEACEFEETNEMGLAWSQGWVMTLEDPREVVLRAAVDKAKGD